MVVITNINIDMQKTADMIRPKNYDFEEISEEREEFEHRMDFLVTRCKSFLVKLCYLK